MIPRKILCPIDFSENSETGIRHATHWAKHFDAQLTVMHVSSDFFGASPETRYYTSAMSSFLSDIAQLQNQVRELNEVDCGSYHCLGDPASEIVEFAEQEQFDLIVVGSSKRNGLSRILWGSVADKVVTHSKVDVLIVNSNAKSPRQPNPLRSVESSRIVVPYDFSDACDYAVEYAAELVNHKSNVIAVNVSDPAGPDDCTGLSPTQREAGIRVSDRCEFRDRMQEIGCLGVDFRTLFSLDVAGRIQRFSKDIEADLMVIPSRQHNLFERVFVGSISRKTAHLAHCPVLMLKDFFRGENGGERASAFPSTALKSQFPED